MTDRPQTFEEWFRQSEYYERVLPMPTDPVRRVVEAALVEQFRVELKRAGLDSWAYKLEALLPGEPVPDVTRLVEALTEVLANATTYGPKETHSPQKLLNACADIARAALAEWEANTKRRVAPRDSGAGEKE